MPVICPPSSDLPHGTVTYIHAWSSIIRKVRSSPQNSAGGVVILAAIDLDALLAAHVLVNLFKQEDIPHSLIPIGGYSELEHRRDQIFGTEDGKYPGNPDVHTLILLSLGSLLPLSSYFPVDTHTCDIHLIDSHRPYNLENVFGGAVNDGLGAGSRNGYLRDGRNGHGVDDENAQSSKKGRIWIWGDGDEKKLENVKKSWEALEYEPESGSDSDSDGSQSDTDRESEDGEEEEQEEEDGDPEDDDDADNSGGSTGKRRRTDGPEDGDRGRRKKKRKEVDPDRVSPAHDGEEAKNSSLLNQPKRLPRALRNAHAERVQRYYQAGTSFGMSVVECCYILASELERGDNDLLWYAIIGLTHQYISSRIDRDTYDKRHALYLDEVARLNPPSPGRNGSSSGTGNPDDDAISASEELRFVLFRHWNLYDAMFHSGYVAGRMGIWKEKGRKKLVGLLAKMGFSIQQSRQSYSHMDMDLKASLRDKLEEIAPEYGLVELHYPSFMRAFGYRCTALSAADGVEGLEALLEAATGIRVEVEQDGGKGGGEWFGATKAWTVSGISGSNAFAYKDDKVDENPNGNGEMTRHARIEQKRCEKNFWVSYDAMQDVKLLSRSLGLAKGLHQAIIRQGCSILDKNSMKTLRAFRFVTIREGPDLRLFSHASTLTRLALWLIDATRDKVTRAAEARKKAPAHPIVLACLDEASETFLIVGISGAPEFGDVKKNRFGLAFQSAAEESGAHARHDMFDTSIVEVKKDDLTGFVECLHLQTA